MLNQRSQIFSPIFSFRSFVVLGFTFEICNFRTHIKLSCIHICEMWIEYNFNSLKQLRSSYIYTVLKLHLALWRQPRGWCGPWWQWIWLTCTMPMNWIQALRRAERGRGGLWFMGEGSSISYCHHKPKWSHPPWTEKTLLFTICKNCICEQERIPGNCS